MQDVCPKNAHTMLGCHPPHNGISAVDMPDASVLATCCVLVQKVVSSVTCLTRGVTAQAQLDTQGSCCSSGWRQRSMYKVALVSDAPLQRPRFLLLSSSLSLPFFLHPFLHLLLFLRTHLGVPSEELAQSGPACEDVQRTGSRNQHDAHTAADGLLRRWRGRGGVPPGVKQTAHDAAPSIEIRHDAGRGDAGGKERKRACKKRRKENLGGHLREVPMAV